MECYSIPNRKGSPSHATAWMTLEDIMVSEISPSHKDKFCMTPVYEGPRGAAFPEAGSRRVVAGAGGHGMGHCCFVGWRFSLEMKRSGDVVP